MGILDNNNQDEAKIVADSLVSEAVGLYNHIRETYTNGTTKFWKNTTATPPRDRNCIRK